MPTFHGRRLSARAEATGLKFEVRAIDGWGMSIIEILKSPHAVTLKLAEFEYYGCFTEVTVRRVSDYELVELAYFTFHTSNWQTAAQRAAGFKHLSARS